MLEIKPIFNAMRRSKVGAFMLLIQIAITTAIVSNAAFIIYDRLQYLQQETGYPEDEIFHFAVLTFGKDRNLSQQFEETETTLRNLPGVINAAAIQEVPLSGSGSASSFGINPTTEQGREGLEVTAAYTFGDEHAIDTLGVKIIAGRNFEQDEVIVAENNDVMPNVSIVSQSFLDEIYPNGDGLGQTIYLGDMPMTIVGVVDKMKGPWLRASIADNFLIIPFVSADNFQRMVVRTEASQRAAVMRQIEDTLLAEYDKRVIVGLQGLDESKREYNASDILMLRMLVVLITVLVLITALGIFGLTVFNINKRTRQIGTRRALGARKSDIVRYFIVENSMICIAGLLIGSIAAVYMGQALLELYSLPALDHNYVAITAAFVFVVSILSVLIPANRAAKISPSVATRSI
ncbi:MAG: FtsX-like permease family protein [Aliiglaciecola sp.]|uniref:ABC transporter permease n=1 Tax=Aliiglaciecola sp. M165 TaxID=2593649 RepID=UPI00117BF0FC|nr:FtsX-like permease family protein [Aliiglaciecola sp. M165]TRY29862.1 FtsX-like permease family protein [Aliiglaciecola sp. M165]